MKEKEYLHRKHKQIKTRKIVVLYYENAIVLAIKSTRGLANKIDTLMLQCLMVTIGVTDGDDGGYMHGDKEWCAWIAEAGFEERVGLTLNI